MQAQSPVPAEERGRATFEEAGDFGVGRDTPLRTLRRSCQTAGNPRRPATTPRSAAAHLPNPRRNTTSGTTASCNRRTSQHILDHDPKAIALAVKHEEIAFPSGDGQPHMQHLGASHLDATLAQKPQAVAKVDVFEIGRTGASSRLRFLQYLPGLDEYDIDVHHSAFLG